LSAPNLCSAQAKDVKGCADSPLISRFPGSYITSCSQVEDDVFSFEMGPGKPPKKIEGKVLNIYYRYPATTSKEQIVRNLNTAVKSAGYTFDYESSGLDVFNVHMGKTWIHVGISGGNWFNEVFVTETAPTQDVVATAAELGSGLSGSGHAVINGILFDTGKADVKPESFPALKEVANLLKGNPALKVYVVGHTDNVGSLAANVDLSRRRAAAVMIVLTTQYGIAATRIAAYGDGPYAPVASNHSEDGRALNRRVELVEQ
jgi:outer membrane protein OmpA-like peptidoglycan-associated protein